MTQPMALEGPTWREEARALVEKWAADGRHFSADDLRNEIGPAPTAGLEGGVFIGASRRGLIEKIADNNSKAKSRNSGHQYMWVGKPEHRLAAAA